MNISVENLHNMIHRIAGECETPLGMEMVLDGELKAYAKLEKKLGFMGIGATIKMFPEVVIPEDKDFATVGKYTDNEGREHFIGITGNLVDGKYDAKYFGYSRISI